MTISAAAIIGLAFAAIISFVTPFAVLAYWRGRMVLPSRNVWLGIVFYGLFAIVLQGALHWYLLRMNPATSAWFENSEWGSAAYLAAAAALFEETARLIALRYFAKRVDGFGTPLSYAVGHGGFECISVALVMAGSVVLCLMLNMGKLDGLFAPVITPEAVAKAYGDLGFFGALMGGTERITAMLTQIGFSLLVWKAVATARAKWFLAAIGAHFALDFVVFLARNGLYSVSILEIGVILLGMVLLAYYLLSTPPKRPA